MLADRLHKEGLSVVVHGDARTNTPPVGLVHLFAGRTFRRCALEVEAFQRAVELWRQEPLAREFPVLRRVQAGDRLDRSAQDHDVPRHYAPRRRSDGWLEYQPGFAVAAQQLEHRLRQNLGDRYISGLAQIDVVPAPRVLALGLGASTEALPEAAWDLSFGRTIEATPPGPPTAIQIGCGLHIAPYPDRNTVILGGRSSALTGPLSDELAKAQELTGELYRPGQEWRGWRCAPALDRRPVLGWLDAERFAFCGFGSRALFWLPYCLDLAVRALTGDPDAVNDPLHWRRLIAQASTP
jgi:hypothetical protein